ncbi:redox-regulated ATPase YchF [Blochmannia endosymbiont of Camponotus sp.]|uniref:redox-regulated ATPase YchF n=1 Tax=Blochmannia endosymbiont of Camponotus sp. TaxID=700220 RepID=UPI002024F811|nr:redox-regulated ATPase YchF [Blochmannia endosymbiont of Camponotus sp.]URJ31063.1 redox-regulated ATPase YchF [Blochmannia endosymbiont of Camponotus sp.]
MQIDCSIIGLPNVGKSTLFSLLTHVSAKVANFPFCTIQPNISIVYIPDLRICQLTDIFPSHKTVHGTMRFIDVAGLIKGAAQGHGMGIQVLNHIRVTKVLCHVVRCFDNNQIIHVFNDIDPCRDVSVVNTELILFDIFQCEQSICALQKKRKIIDVSNKQQLFLLKKCLECLYNGVFLRKIQFSNIERINIERFNFLTIKPIIYIANIDEKSVINNIYLNRLHALASNEQAPLVSCCAMLPLLKNKNNGTRVTMERKESVLHDINNTIFSVLNLCTFFTINLNVTRAWICVIGTTALEAAKMVHSDFKKGFIRARVIKFNDFILYNGELGVKRGGKIYYEGKDYRVEDGDILKFLFKT